jgi:hypothetical protein
MENEQTPQEILIEKIKFHTGDWYSDEAIEAYLDHFGYTGEDDEDPQEIGNEFQDAYQGEYSDDEEFTRELLESTGYLPADLPDWIKIDFQETWDCGLSYDYFENNGFYFRNN